MSSIRLAAQERLLAAYGRYQEVEPGASPEELADVRLALCQALLDCGEELPLSVLAQMNRDRALLEQVRGPSALTVTG